MDFTLLLTIIDKYGLPLVAIVILWNLFVRWGDRIIDYFLMPKKNEKQEMGLEANMVFNSKIKSLLREYLGHMRADWVQLWQFNNGTRTVGTSIPYYFVGITHEVVSEGTEQMMFPLRNIPTSLFSWDELLQNSVVVHEKKETDERYGLSKMMRGFNAHKAYLRIIRNEDHAIIGILAVGFRKKEGEEIKHENIVIHLGVLATSIIVAMKEYQAQGQDRKQ